MIRGMLSAYSKMKPYLLHFEFQNYKRVSRGNGICRGFQEVFSTMDAMLFHQKTCKTGNNTVKISMTSHSSKFRRSKPIILNMHSISLKTWKRMLYNLIQFFVNNCGRRR